MPWQSIDCKLLNAALDECKVPEGAYDLRTDVNRSLIKAVVEYLEEADLFCDHSVGICCCGPLGLLQDLREWVNGRERCSKCGGDGWDYTPWGMYELCSDETEYDPEYDMNMPVYWESGLTLPQVQVAVSTHPHLTLIGKFLGIDHEPIRCKECEGHGYTKIEPLRTAEA